MKYYSYDEFRKDTLSLIEQTKDKDIDAIVAIARGGFTLAHAMAEGLDIRKVESIRTELYDNETKRDKISIYNNAKLDGVKKVLVVDDISDSGDTLKAVIEDLKNKHNSVEFVTATLFYKKTSVFKPDIWINEANEWIEFFWERDFI
jgi:xanthine phosphoribosyltransferase